MQSARVARRVYAGTVLASLAIALAATLAAPLATQESPQHLNIRYELDASAGQASWALLPDSGRLPAALAAAAPFARSDAPFAGGISLPAFRAPAPLLPLMAPRLSVLASDQTAGGSSWRVQLACADAAPELWLLFPPQAAVHTVQLGSQQWPLATLPHGGTYLDFLNLPPDGITVSFHSPQTSFEVLLQQQRYGLPAQGAFLQQARPATSVAWQNGDVTVVSARVRLDQPGSSMRTAAAPMTAVAIQPSARIARLTVYRPITDFLDASSRMTAISGTATTPLITALQNSARIGLIGRYWIPSPASTLTAMTP
jgi:hypothetical protein